MPLVTAQTFRVIAEQFPVEFVFSDHRDAYVLERAENPWSCYPMLLNSRNLTSKADYEGAIVELWMSTQIDLGLFGRLYENRWSNLASSL